MLKEQIYNLLKAKTESNISDLNNFKQIAEEYPFFNSVYSLLIKQNGENVDSQLLEKAAIRANSRSNFKKFIHYNITESNIETEKEAQVEEIENNSIENNIKDQQPELNTEQEVEEQNIKPTDILAGAGLGTAATAAGIAFNNKDEEIESDLIEENTSLDEKLPTETTNEIYVNAIEAEIENDEPIYQLEDELKTEEALEIATDNSNETFTDILEDNQEMADIQFEDELELLNDIDDENELDIANDFIFENKDIEGEDLILSDSTDIESFESDSKIENNDFLSLNESDNDAGLKLESEIPETTFENIEADDVTRSKLLAKIGNALPNEADDLTQIDGITSELQQQLNKNGIYTFLQLKNSNNTESKLHLAELLNFENANAINWDEHAMQHYVKKYKNVLLDRVGKSDFENADDLKKLNGVGPVLEKKLNEAGFFSFSQISNLSSKDTEVLTELLGYFPGRIERDDWVGQAKRKIELQQRQIAAENTTTDSDFSIQTNNNADEVDPALEELRNKLKARKELKDESLQAEENLESEISIEEDNEFTSSTFIFDEQDDAPVLENISEVDLVDEASTATENEIENEVIEESDDADDSLSFTSWLTKIDKDKDEDSKKKALTNEEEPLLVKVEKTNVDQIKAFTGNEPELAEVESVTDIRENANQSLEENKLLVSETLAKIYEEQEYFKKAIKTYEKLSLKYPEKSIYFAGRIADLKKK